MSRIRDDRVFEVTTLIYLITLLKPQDKKFCGFKSLLVNSLWDCVAELGHFGTGFEYRNSS